MEFTFLVCLAVAWIFVAIAGAFAFGLLFAARSIPIPEDIDLDALREWLEGRPIK